MIKIENLKKNFGDTCACDIPSFTIKDGEILGLVGNNGAGKTTLFRLLLDLLKADDGSVEYVFATIPDGTTPDGAATTPDRTATTPDRAATTPDRAATTPDGSPSGINPAESDRKSTRLNSSHLP